MLRLYSEGVFSGLRALMLYPITPHIAEELWEMLGISKTTL